MLRNRNRGNGQHLPACVGKLGEQKRLSKSKVGKLLGGRSIVGDDGRRPLLACVGVAVGGEGTMGGSIIDQHRPVCVRLCVWGGGGARGRIIAALAGRRHLLPLEVTRGHMPRSGAPKLQTPRSPVGA